MFNEVAIWIAFRDDRKAVTAVEYGIIAALVAVVIITSVATAGSNLTHTFNSIGSHI